MTSVTAWYEPHDDFVWVVADTRISGSVGVLSDSGAKIFPLSIVCMQPDSAGEFVPISSFALGFAYSGSTLAALMTYTLANTCLGNLIGAAGAALPTIGDIADFVRRLGERYCREIQAGFEAVIVGWCPSSKKYRAFVLKPMKATFEQELMQVTLTEAAMYDSDSFVLIGSHQQEVSERIKLTYKELEGQTCSKARATKDR